MTAADGEPPSAGGAPAGRLFELTVPARPACLKLVRAAVAWAAEEAGADAAWRDDLVMAVDEACQNVIRHGYGGPCDRPLVLRADRAGDRLTVRVIDAAPPVDPASVRPRPLDDLRPGGLGTRLMREVLDEVAYETPPAGGGNVLRLSRRLG